MEEEEVLTDPKDPFSKYGGKQVSAKVTTTEPDPFAKYGGKLKKKYFIFFFFSGLIKKGRQVLPRDS